MRLSGTRRLLEALACEGVWRHYDIPIGDRAESFKRYLRDHGMQFEPSSNGDYVHFEVASTNDADLDDYAEFLNGINEAAEMSNDELVDLLETTLAEMLRDLGYPDGTAPGTEIVVDSDSFNRAIRIWFISALGSDIDFDITDNLSKVLQRHGHRDSYFYMEEPGRWLAIVGDENED